MQQTRTALQQNGPDHLELWFKLTQECEDEFSRADVATYGLKLVYPTAANVKTYQPVRAGR